MPGNLTYYWVSAKTIVTFLSSSDTKHFQSRVVVHAGTTECATGSRARTAGVLFPLAAYPLPAVSKPFEWLTSSRISPWFSMQSDVCSRATTNGSICVFLLLHFSLSPFSLSPFSLLHFFTFTFFTFTLFHVHLFTFTFFTFSLLRFFTFTFFHFHLFTFTFSLLHFFTFTLHFHFHVFYFYVFSLLHFFTFIFFHFLYRWHCVRNKIFNPKWPLFEVLTFETQS